VVYSQPPAAGPEVVLKDLARYVHRAPISNSRLVSLTEGELSFMWKDYAQGGKERVLRLSGEEFLRRWVQHVLPRGFVKVRHYGLLANGRREEKLAVCRGQVLQAGLRVESSARASGEEAPKERGVSCPACGAAVWVKGAEVPRAGKVVPAPDTS
jgi:hypothetical protein